ncbi:hypothetical protein CAEBREN_24240 [Caenorhabditis brenneri]|uniref:Uncharacterized protein n=1 Tax=Caenorhabditis brenneri TaxID=135651 RepID=G0MJ51_CAEBE|nr:hypothetical protein CAEBREN_24240 [Caenorhabditis brenneri]
MVLMQLMIPDSFDAIDGGRRYGRYIPCDIRRYFSLDLAATCPEAVVSTAGGETGECLYSSGYFLLLGLVIFIGFLYAVVLGYHLVHLAGVRKKKSFFHHNTDMTSMGQRALESTLIFTK